MFQIIPEFLCTEGCSELRIAILPSVKLVTTHAFAGDISLDCLVKNRNATVFPDSFLGCPLTGCWGAATAIPSPMPSTISPFLSVVPTQSSRFTCNGCGTCVGHRDITVSSDISSTIANQSFQNCTFLRSVIIPS